MARNSPTSPKGTLAGSPGFSASRSVTPPESKSHAAQKRQFGSTVARGHTIETPPPNQAGIRALITSSAFISP